MSRKIEDVYKKVEHKEHILMRPERHVGTCKPRTENTWLIGENNVFKFQDVTYRPALIKLFDEIITNSVDFSKTPEGKHLNKIDVEICNMSGCITVTDNGGIAVVKHEDYGGMLPDMLFGELFSSSNYNEDDEALSNKTGAGQNGEGASLVNVFSKLFTVVTCDGKLKFERTWKDNTKTICEEKITKCSRNGTSISFVPDIARFPAGNLHHDYSMMQRRVYEIAACNPDIEVTYNGRKISVYDFKSFCDHLDCKVIEDINPDWKIGLFNSTNGFSHFSYVNSVQTRVGGAHIDYVLNKIIEHARPKLKRTYKVDYKPSFIKNVLGLVLVCNIDLPRFNGQTKEDLTTTVSEFGTKWEPTDKFLKDSTKCIVEWFKGFHQSLELKAEDEALEQTQKEAEQLKFYQIPKYMRATSTNRQDCTLFLTEGDCLEENTKIIVYSKDGIVEKSLKTIETGDLVLTHNNRLKPIVNKFNKVSKCIELETELGVLKCSPEHKWFVYDKISKTYRFEHTKNLEKERHSLVENLLTGVEYIDSITLIKRGDFEIGGRHYEYKIQYGGEYIYSSNLHNFLVFDYEDLSYKMVTASNLTTKHGMVSR